MYTMKVAATAPSFLPSPRYPHQIDYVLIPVLTDPTLYAGYLWEASGDNAHPNPLWPIYPFYPTTLLYKENALWPPEDPHVRLYHI